MAEGTRAYAIRVLAAAGVTLSLAACSGDSSNLTRPLDPSLTPEFAKTAAASGPVVTSANPSASKRDTTLDVQVIGSGFASGSRVDFLLSGAVDPNIHTNSTRYVSSTELVANITIDATAAIAYRDVAVTTAAGKKGIGTEAFVVLNGGEITVAGLSPVYTNDLNSSGVAVGYGTYTAGCGNRGFVWSQGTGAMLLPLPTGYCASIADAISEGGLIIGPIAKKGSAWELARWTPDGSGSYTIEVIGHPPNGSTWLTTHGVNDTGSISSSWRNADGSLDSWYWNGATGWFRLARPTGSTFCELEKMNAHDEMVGYCHTSSGTGIYWSSPTSSAVQLPSPTGGVAGNAYWIDASSTIRGASTIGGVDHTVLWVPNGAGGWTVQDLGAMKVADRNEQGSILITSTTTAQYTPAGGVAENLGVHLTTGNVADQSVNGTTWIVGYGSSGSGAQTRAYWFRR